MVAWTGLASAAELPFAIAHLDPGLGVTVPAAVPSAEATAKLEFPIALFLITKVPAMIGMLGGRATPDDVLAPLPPLSPQYIAFASRALPGPWAFGGGLGLRVRPFGRVEVAVVRNAWVDVNGRYGTRGWGVDAGLGTDLALSPVVALGPELSVVREGGDTRVVASLSLSFSVLAVGRPIWID